MFSRNINFLLFLFILFVFQSCSTVKQQNNLIGPTSLENWKNSKYWNEKAYLDYEPNTQKCDFFKISWKRNHFKIIIFASIYCDECLENIPELYKILEYTRFQNESLLFYGLDEYSTEPTGFYKKFKFDKTPAVFLEYDDGRTFSVQKGPDWLESILQICQEIK